jgi:cytochrome c oxidase subunit 2
MMDPYAKVVKGFQKVMPSFRGRLTAPEAAALVEFIKSLRTDNLENLSSKEPLYGPVEQRR